MNEGFAPAASRKFEKQDLILGGTRAVLQPTGFCAAGCDLVRRAITTSTEVMR
jgi:hypothetical protein